MTRYDPPDNDVPLPVLRRTLNPLDEAAIAHAERRVAEGMTDYGAIMDAIAVVDPSPGQRLEATYSRLSSRFRKKHGPRNGRKLA